MYVCYLSDDNEIDVERCQISLRDKSPMALSALYGAGRVAYVTGFVQSIEFDPNCAIGLRWRLEMDVLTVASLGSPARFLELVRSQSAVDSNAGDRPTSEPALNSPSVVPHVGESITPRVRRHVRVDLELQAGAGRGALDHAAPLNPENDVTVYTVVEDFGDLGRPFGAGGRRKPR